MRDGPAYAGSLLFAKETKYGVAMGARREEEEYEIGEEVHGGRASGTESGSQGVRI